MDTQKVDGGAVEGQFEKLRAEGWGVEELKAKTDHRFQVCGLSTGMVKFSFSVHIG